VPGTPDPHGAAGGRGVLATHWQGAGGLRHGPTEGRLRPVWGDGEGAWRGCCRDGKGDGGGVEVLGTEARSTPGL